MAVRRAGFEDTLQRLGVTAEALEQARTVAAKQGLPLRTAFVRTADADLGKAAKAMSELCGLPVLESIERCKRDLDESIARWDELETMSSAARDARH